MSVQTISVNFDAFEHPIELKSPHIPGAGARMMAIGGTGERALCFKAQQWSSGAEGGDGGCLLDGLGRAEDDRRRRGRRGGWVGGAHAGFLGLRGADAATLRASFSTAIRTKSAGRRFCFAAATEISAASSAVMRVCRNAVSWVM